jgi:hypothetical protein
LRDEARTQTIVGQGLDPCGAESSLQSQASSGRAHVRYRQPVDRRSRLQRWRDVVAELQNLQDEYQAWLEALRAICDFDLSELESIVPPRVLAATNLLHDVKCDQIATRLTHDEAH